MSIDVGLDVSRLSNVRDLIAQLEADPTYTSSNTIAMGMLVSTRLSVSVFVCVRTSEIMRFGMASSCLCVVCALRATFVRQSLQDCLSLGRWGLSLLFMFFAHCHM